IQSPAEVSWLSPRPTGLLVALYRVGAGCGVRNTFLWMAAVLTCQKRLQPEQRTPLMDTDFDTYREKCLEELRQKKEAGRKAYHFVRKRAQANKANKKAQQKPNP